MLLKRMRKGEKFFNENYIDKCFGFGILKKNSFKMQKS